MPSKKQLKYWESKKGKHPWNYGIPCSEEQKIKLREKTKGKRKPRTGIILRGENHPCYIKDRTKLKWPPKGFRKGRLKGEKHPNWKGGISTLIQRLRVSLKYREWRDFIFQRDNYTCQECGVRGKKGIHVCLEAHHIKQFALILKENYIKILEEVINCEELWNINNGITLCKKCHYKTDTYGKKKLIY